MGTQACDALHRVLNRHVTRVALSVMFCLVLVESPLFGISNSLADGGVADEGGPESLENYPGLRKALADAFPGTPSAMVVITGVVDGEPKTLTLFDPDFAVGVPRGQAPEAAGSFEIDIGTEVQTLTLTASPDCHLKKSSGGYVWVVRSDTCPPPPN